MPTETTNTPRSDWTTRRATLMRSIVERCHNLPVRVGLDEIPESFDSADALEAWEQESRERTMLSTIADALVEAGVGSVGQADYESVPGALAWLVANGFNNGVYFATDEHLLPNGKDDRAEQRERNAAVLRVLNDPTDERHDRLVELLTEMGISAEALA